MKTEVMTKLILNTWDPYIIKYPNPSLDTNNSPMMTPIKDILILIFKQLIMVKVLLGKTALMKICRFFALKEHSSVI